MFGPLIEDIIYIGQAGFGHRSRIVRICLDRLLERLARQSIILLGLLLIVRDSTQVELVGLQIFRREAGKALEFGALQFAPTGTDHPDDGPGDLLLRSEDVLGRPLVALRPDVSAGGRVDQVGIDPQRAVGPLHGAFEHVAYPEIARDVLHLHRAILVLERRVGGGHKQARELREVGDDVVGDAVGEVGLLRVAGEILERQHGDRGLRRQVPWGTCVRAALARVADATPMEGPHRCEQQQHRPGGRRGHPRYLRPTLRVVRTIVCRRWIRAGRTRSEADRCTGRAVPRLGERSLELVARPLAKLAAQKVRAARVVSLGLSAAPALGVELDQACVCRFVERCYRHEPARGRDRDVGISGSDLQIEQPGKSVCGQLAEPVALAQQPLLKARLAGLGPLEKLAAVEVARLL